MDVFSLKATLGLDTSKYESGLNRAKSLASSIGSGLKTAATIGAATIGAATAAVGAFGGVAVKSYAEYEQLVGGVDKLYGDASRKLQQYADQAYKTSGMSANKYMETATSFSAALIKSLGNDYDKAADMTDVAMQAISDNVNVFGSDMASVQNAFQGFAKQNYTMLDNLKLGYGGTKEQMEQLIADANEWAATNGKAADLSINSFADVVTAIDYIQQKQGIAGTTTMEAMKTLEGSAIATKAAWQNVITAIGRGEGLSEAFDGLVKSIFGEKDGEGLLNQIIPRIQGVMEGIGEFVTTAAPYITEKLPELVSAVLPEALESAVTLLGAIGQGIIDNAPVLFNTLLQIGGQLGSTVLQMMETAAQSISQFNWAGTAQKIADFLKEALTGNGITRFIDAAFEIISGFATGLGEALPELAPVAVEIVISLVENLLNNVDKLTTGAVDLMVGLATGLTDALPILIEKAPVIIEKLVEALIIAVPKLYVASTEIMIKLIEGIIKNLPKMLDAGMKIVTSLYTGMVNFLGRMTDAGRQIMNTLGNTIKGFNVIQWGKDMLDSFIQGIKDRMGRLGEAVRGIGKTIKDNIGFSEPKEGPLANFHTFAPDMMELFAKGIADNEDMLRTQIQKSFDFGSIVAPSNMEGTGGTVGNIYITVNGAEGQSEERLAEIVSNRLLHELNMKKAVTPTYA